MPHNNDFYEWMGKKHLCFFQTAETGKRAPNVKAAVLTTTLGSSPFSLTLKCTLNKIATQHATVLSTLSTHCHWQLQLNLRLGVDLTGHIWNSKAQF